MIIFTDTYIPYEFKTRQDCYAYIVERCHGIKRSLRLVEKDIEHLTVRCPISGDYLEVVGSVEELIWLDNELRRHNWYRIR